MISATTLLIRFSIVIGIVLIIDLYVFKGIKMAFSSFSLRTKQIVYWSYWLINFSFIAGVIYTVLTFSRNENPRGGLFVFLAGMLVLLVVPKLVFSLFLLAEDIYRIVRASVVSSGKLFLVKESMDSIPAWISRRKFISQLGLGVAAIPFISILYGLTKGKYNYKVHRVNVPFKDLPVEFDGFTVTHISDVHAGSFDSEEDVTRGIELINEQKSNLIVFTGDLVNNFASEMTPWVPLFSSLQASHGKYSITGNHDYGDYVEWASPEEKMKNFESFKEVHKNMGFKLLLNENTFIEKEGSRIALLGIENWGRGGFSKYGDFTKTLTGVEPHDFKILMSHDPSHWDDQVTGHEQHVHLSLAGHTHGMQFGVEIPGIKWSPIKYRYPRWAGLYEKAEKYLYVNRGFGFIGFPGRVGIWPEITVITLQKA